MLVAAISGGAAIPPMTGALADATNFHTAMALPTAFYVLAWAFPVYANFFNSEVLDGHRNTTLNVEESQIRKGKDAFMENGEEIEKEKEAEVIRVSHAG
jgi:FHS family L-fucose permease-like MFS transporter